MERASRAWSAGGRVPGRIEEVRVWLILRGPRGPEGRMAFGDPVPLAEAAMPTQLCDGHG